jgi:sugar lactone lactonase YvrE
MAEHVFCAFEAKNTLGEGPIWDPATNRLYWFDIKQALLYCGDPSNNKLEHWKLPCRASAAAVRSKGGLLLATEQGLANFDPDSGAFELRWKWEPEPGFRSNDGKIDVAGRFWWGSMDDDHGRRPGKLYCYTPDGRCEERVDGIHIVNTVSCSPDGRTYYLADTRKREIWAFDVGEDGSLSNRRTFARPDGNPDGSAVDAQGYLWNAHWGSWRIVRHAPDGSVDRILEVPVEQPSSCAFGGPDLTTLYITTAREDLSEEALAQQPLAGSVLAVEVGVKGLALPSFNG